MKIKIGERLEGFEKSIIERISKYSNKIIKLKNKYNLDMGGILQLLAYVRNTNNTKNTYFNYVMQENDHIRNELIKNNDLYARYKTLIDNRLVLKMIEKKIKEGVAHDNKNR